MHPKMFEDLSKLKGLYAGIMQGKMYAVFDTDLKDFVKSDIIDGKTGYHFFMEHFTTITHAENDSDIRDLRIRFVVKYKEGCMYDFILILPAGLRDIEVGDDGRTVEDDINPLYRKMLRAVNTISVYGNDNTSPVLDTVRWSMQRTFTEIYDYLESVLTGKKGFIQAKYAARNTFRGTRNVITAMDPAPAVLGSENAITVNDTVCGLYQYLKGTVEASIYCIRTGPLQRGLDKLPSAVMVVDPKTLHSIIIEADQKTVSDWGTAAGIEGLINAFFKPNKRHMPVYIKGYYAALLYQDDTTFKVLYDIDELPDGKDRGNVRPITWTEMFYISVYKKSKQIVGNSTRYPIAELGSINPSKVYLRTTAKSKVLTELNDQWEPMPGDNAICFPILNEPFFESMSVHPSKIKAFNADFDGDKMSLHYALSKEAVKETVDYLHTKDAFVHPNGSLRYGVNNNISALVIYSYSFGLEYKWYMDVGLFTPADKDELAQVSLEVLKESKFAQFVETTKSINLDFELRRIVKYTTGNNLLIVGKVQDKIVGFIRFESRGDKTGIFGIGILELYQGKGYSKRLMNLLLSTLRRKEYESITLTVDNENTVAVKLYQSLGFKDSKDSLESTHTNMIYYFKD
jgi:RimJ/RimL family protein N-acetyltransferase